MTRLLWLSLPQPPWGEGGQGPGILPSLPSLVQPKHEPSPFARSHSHMRNASRTGCRTRAGLFKVATTVCHYHRHLPPSTPCVSRSAHIFYPVSRIASDTVFPPPPRPPYQHNHSDGTRGEKRLSSTSCSLPCMCVRPTCHSPLCTKKRRGACLNEFWWSLLFYFCKAVCFSLAPSCDAIFVSRNACLTCQLVSPGT